MPCSSVTLSTSNEARATSFAALRESWNCGHIAEIMLVLQGFVRSYKAEIELNVPWCRGRSKAVATSALHEHLQGLQRALQLVPRIAKASRTCFPLCFELSRGCLAEAYFVTRLKVVGSCYAY